MSTPPLQTKKNQPPPLPQEYLAQVKAKDVVVQEQTPEQRTRARFEKVLGKDVMDQGYKIVEKTITFITDNKAYFRREQLVNRALNASRTEVAEEILELKEFEQYIRWVVARRDFKEVGKTNCVTTHEMWNDEVKIVKLAGREDPVFEQPKDVVESAIARKDGISDEQSEAVKAASLSKNAVTVIEGSAGAGKSFTMEAVKEIYMAQGYHVIGTALGWTAAKVLGESAKLDDANCRAIEGLTQDWLAARANRTDPFPGPTLVIVDEVGMVGIKHMAIILEQAALSRYPVKVVLTGDSYQVSPIAAGNALELIIRNHGTTRIDTIRRQHQFSHRRMVAKLSKKISGPALHTLLHQERLHWCKDTDMVLNMVVQHYVSYRLAYPKKKALVLTGSNKEVLELNFRIRAAYKKLGLIDTKDVRLTVNNSKDVFETDFSEGDDVVLRANDRNLVVYEIDPKKSLNKPHTWKPIKMGVFNRNSGRIVKILHSKDPVGSYDFVIDLDGDNPARIIVNSVKFKAYGKKGMPMLHNYAGTIYSSQGQTVEQVFLIDSWQINFRLAYVGASRHKENIDVYLNETELHRRLDNVTGRRQSLNAHIAIQKSGKSLDDAVVALGRYTASSMLQSVAVAWGKHSDNLSAMVFEHMHRTQLERATSNAKDTDVKPTNLEDVVVDFLPEYNTRYPLVDIAKILDLPDPIEESALVRESDTEENRKRFGAQEMPIDAERTPLPMDARASPQREHAGVLPTAPKRMGQALSWLLGKNTPQPPPLPAPSLRQADPTSAFKEESTQPSSDFSLLGTLKQINRWLNPTPNVAIPYLDNTQSCGHVVFPPFDKDIDYAQRWEGVMDPRTHYLNFDGVPTLANVQGEPDREWVAAQKDTLWAVGRFGEPRILARNPYGEVVARYRMDGECVVGDGQAPIIVNRTTDENGRFNKQVYIVAGAKEWLWLRHTMETNYASDPAKIPHILWAAKDVDWNLMAPHLNAMERVVIVRSKSDDRQIPWAQSLQQILRERYNVQTVISPSIPQHTVDVESSSKMKM